MDYFFQNALVAQLQEQLHGAILNKVFQPQPHIIILRLWNGGKQVRLLLGTGGVEPRLYLTDQQYRNPVRPPRFCQLLRARLKRLISIEMDSHDRVVRLHFQGNDDSEYTLVAELFGRTGNLLLLNQQQHIVDTLQRSSETCSRAQMVGAIYNPPAVRGSITLDMAAQQLSVMIDGEQNAGNDIQQWLLENVVPMSRNVAQLLAIKAQHSSLSEVLGSFVEQWHNGKLQPYSNGNVLSMQLHQGEVASEVNLSDFAQQYYIALESQSAINGENDSDLRNAVKKGLKRLRQRLSKIDQQIEVCLLADDEKNTGDLLLANLHNMQRGMHSIEVYDYFQDPPTMITIELDSAKTPQENAQLHYKRHRKAKRGLEHCQRRLSQTEYEIEWLEQIAQQLSEQGTGASVNSGDSDILRQELIDGGWYKPQTAVQRDTRRITASSLVKRDTTPSGWELIWGSNNKTNDYLTKQLLKPHDLWFHAHKIPGCHLILKNDGAEVAQADQIYAARIAAIHSRAVNDTHVEVMVTEGKNVQRIKGAPLGLVKVKQYQVLTIKMA